MGFKLVPSVVEIHAPPGDRAPVVLDSPHSGRVYPADFGHAISADRVRRLEDAYVDQLFARAPAHGATLVRALFPRSYVDANRAPDDIDESLLDDPWPGGANPGPKVRLGIGLVAKRDIYGYIYDRRLSVGELRRRLSAYYWPYHRALQRVLDDLHRQEGMVWHLNCHSMRSIKRSGSGGGRSGASRRRRVDFCVGDRDGSSCSAEFTHLVADTLRELGYSVAVNEPYKGVEILRRYSDPLRNRHGLQLEINRALYMDERRVAKHGGFAALERDLGRLIGTLCDYARARAGGDTEPARDAAE